MNTINQSQQGAVAVYITLLMLIMITSSAIVLSSVFSEQLRASREIISSERAFYAANSGVEEGLYQLVYSYGNENIEFEGEVPYNSEQAATYDVQADLILSEDGTTLRPCIASTGEHSREERRISLNPGGGSCDD